MINNLNVISLLLFIYLFITDKIYNIIMHIITFESARVNGFRRFCSDFAGY